MTRSSKLIIALALVGIGFSPGFAEKAKARVILKESTSYYTVTGSTGKEIYKNMINKGPNLGGVRGHALATTEYKYDVRNIDVNVVNGRCVPKKLDVVVSVKYTYPKWRGSSKARSSTRNAWNNFRKAVVWHERQHVKIAMEYAKDFEKVLRQSRLRFANNDCNTNSFRTAFKANQIALRHNRKQKQFDRRDLRRGGRGYEAQMQLIKAR